MNAETFRLNFESVKLIRQKPLSYPISLSLHIVALTQKRDTTSKRLTSKEKTIVAADCDHMMLIFCIFKSNKQTSGYLLPLNLLTWASKQHLLMAVHNHQCLLISTFVIILPTVHLYMENTIIINGFFLLTSGFAVVSESLCLISLAIVKKTCSTFMFVFALCKSISMHINYHILKPFISQR